MSIESLEAEFTNISNRKTSYFMDISFYEDQVMPVNSPSEDKMYDKTALRLDFNASTARRPKSLFDNVNNNAILTSPDLNLLKLASPELEKLIMQNAGGLLTTPTPNGIFKGNLTVTEEQEKYASGFVLALQKLHQQAQPEASSSVTSTACENLTLSSARTVTTNPVFTASTLVSPSTASLQPVSTTCTNTFPINATSSLTTISTQSLPLETIPAVQVSSAQAAPGNPQTIIWPNFQSQLQVSLPNIAPLQTFNFGQPISSQAPLSAVKYEDQGQVVPGTPPLPPIDLDLQEEKKNLRKKQRNRKAASKCRKRKLEKEAQLEMKVKEEKEKNQQLQLLAVNLRKQVCQLKEQVMLHVSAGCRVMVTGQSEGIQV